MPASPTTPVMAPGRMLDQSIPGHPASDAPARFPKAQMPATSAEGLLGSGLPGRDRTVIIPARSRRGSTTGPLVVTWGFDAARSYSLMRPPRAAPNRSAQGAPTRRNTSLPCHFSHATGEGPSACSASSRATTGDLLNVAKALLVRMATQSLCYCWSDGQLPTICALRMPLEEGNAHRFCVREYAPELGGAKRARTADLLHAMNHQHVHGRRQPLVRRRSV